MIHFETSCIVKWYFQYFTYNNFSFRIKAENKREKRISNFVCKKVIEMQNRDHLVSFNMHQLAWTEKNKIRLFSEVENCVQKKLKKLKGSKRKSVNKYLSRNNLHRIKE